jgi:uncharacterized protein (DUF1810 family)
MADINRFIHAQDDFDGYQQAIRELKAGRKTGHWIWYIFPQIQGLGRSSNSKLYAISSLDEAKEYLAHPVLGARLRECTRVILSYKGDDIYAIMGSNIDAIKLRSSMTLFDIISPNDIFGEVLDSFYGCRRDQRTIDITKADGKSQNTL